MQWFLQHSDPSLLINKHPAFSEEARKHNSEDLFEDSQAGFGMGKSRRSVGERHGTLKLKVLVQKLRNSFSLCRSLSEEETRDEVFRAYEVPEDVKEGCFAVSAIDGGTPKRFVVGLAYLNHPEFVKLLAKAEEEFGFEQPGALAVPCLASDLQSILADS